MPLLSVVISAAVCASRLEWVKRACTPPFIRMAAENGLPATEIWSKLQLRSSCIVLPNSDELPTKLELRTAQPTLLDKYRAAPKLVAKMLPSLPSKWLRSIKVWLPMLMIAPPWLMPEPGSFSFSRKVESDRKSVV